jgi:predicted phage terminase large subunit-like protein
LKSKEFLLERKSLMLATSWQSLYQGSPIVQDGEMFEISKIKIVDYEPSRIIRTVRYWDKAGTEGGGARTAGVRVSICLNGEFYIDCVKKEQFGAAKREQLIKAIAQLDGIGVKIGIEQEPGSGGKESAESTVKNLRGFSVTVDKVSGSKELRAEPYAVQVGMNNVFMKRAEWNKEFIDEHQTFPNGKYKDQVDATAGAFAILNAGNVGQMSDDFIPDNSPFNLDEW